MALPNNKISTSLVATALGTTSSDVGTLCTHPNVNKWSKHKPVVQPYVNVNGLLDWWKALDGKCGLDVPVYTGAGAITTSGSFLYDLKNKNYAWDYIKPAGGASSPYRIGDFREYEHSAVIPIGSMPTYNAFLDLNNTVQIDLEEVIQSPDAYNLTLQDITHEGVDMRSYYLGVMLYKPSNAFIYCTTINKISNGNLSIILNDMGANVGNWNAAFFMCSVQLMQGGTLPQAKYIPIDLPHSSVIVNSIGSSASILIDGFWNTLNTMIIYRYELYNDRFTERTMTGVQCVLIRTMGEQIPEEGSIVITQSKASVIVPPKDSVIITNNTFNHNRNTSYTYWVGISADDILMTYNQVEEDPSESI